MPKRRKNPAPVYGRLGDWKWGVVIGTTIAVVTDDMKIASRVAREESKRKNRQTVLVDLRNGYDIAFFKRGKEKIVLYRNR